MEERKQPGRIAKRKSEDTSSVGDYDYGDDMDDLQGRLDRLLGRDSDSDANYNPDSGDEDTVSSDGGKKDPIEDGVRNIDLSPVGDDANDEISEDSDIENMRQKRKIATAKRRVIPKTKSKKLNVVTSGDGMAIKKGGRSPGGTEDMLYFHDKHITLLAKFLMSCCVSKKKLLLYQDFMVRHSFINFMMIF